MPATDDATFRVVDASGKEVRKGKLASAGEIPLAYHAAEAGRKTRAGHAVRLVDILADAGAGHGLFENLHGFPGGAAFANTLKERASLYPIVA